MARFHRGFITWFNLWVSVLVVLLPTSIFFPLESAEYGGILAIYQVRGFFLTDIPLICLAGGLIFDVFLHQGFRNFYGVFRENASIAIPLTLLPILGLISALGAISSSLAWLMSLRWLASVLLFFSWLYSGLSSGREFSTSMFSYSLAGVISEFSHFWVLLAGSFMGVGVILGLVGLWRLLRSNWILAGGTLLMFMGHVIFYIDYSVADKDLMFLPAYLIWALWMGVGAKTIFEKALDYWSRRGRAFTRMIQAGIPGLFMLTTLAAVLVNWPLVDLSRDTSTRDQAESILSVVEPNAIIIGYWDVVPPVEYLQKVGGRRQDVLAVNRF